MDSVSFRHMIDGTRADYALVMDLHARMKADHHVDSLLSMLKATGVPEAGYKIDRLQHALQSASRAEDDGADEEWIVAALLHDIGDLLAPDDHALMAAAILRPYVSETTFWVVKKHGIFQGYYFWHHLDLDRNARDRYRDHPNYDACVAFCERWDQTSFDPDYPTRPLKHFEPMVRCIFAREPFSVQDGTPSMGRALAQ
ncbi:MAG: HD domain-containing protein [Rhodospirillales bacterium]|nr:HD domain-containing protein [Rhodospirillales bacterium]